MSWISEEDREFWTAAEERYIEWCAQNGLEPFVCPEEDCDRRLPCRRHPPELYKSLDLDIYH